MRGGFVGALSAAVAVAAHAMGGGAAPTESAAVLLVLACGAVGALASTARVRTAELPFLVGALTAGQAVGHAALTAGAPAHHGMQLSPAMLTAHAVAVVVCALAVRGGRRGCALAAASLHRILPAPFVPLPVAMPIGRRVTAYRPRFARRILVGARVGRRGPPLAA